MFSVCLCVYPCVCVCVCTHAWVCMFVYMCVCVCVYMCKCRYMCICIHVETRGWSHRSSSITFYLFKKGSLTAPGTCDFDQSGWTKSSIALPIFVPHPNPWAWIIAIVPDTYLCAGDLKTVPQACIASTSPYWLNHLPSLGSFLSDTLTEVLKFWSSNNHPSCKTPTPHFFDCSLSLPWPVLKEVKLCPGPQLPLPCSHYASGPGRILKAMETGWITGELFG